LLAAGCGGGDSQENQASEKEDLAEKKKAQRAEEKTTASPFEGEHEDLQSGDTAIWRQGPELTISDIHVAPNLSRQQAEEDRKKQEAQGKEAKNKSPAEQYPPELVVFSWTVTNNGQTPIMFNGELPCEGLDSNGVMLPSGGIAAEQSESARARPLAQPLESGQTREGVGSRGTPPNSTTFEIVCAHPPQQGGKPNIAQIPDQGKASWVADVSELEFRDVGGP